MKRNKTKLTMIITIVLLIASISMLNQNILVQAQDLPEDIVIGPAPAGVTSDMRVPTELVLMVRPNPVGHNQIFLVNIWTVRAPGAHRAFLGYEIQ